MLDFGVMDQTGNPNSKIEQPQRGKICDHMRSSGRADEIQPPVRRGAGKVQAVGLGKML